MMRRMTAGFLLLMLMSSAMGEEAHESGSRDGDYLNAQAYYVNAEGGRYVHTRRDCPSVSAEYQDSMITLTSEEAAALGDAYQPCAVCGERVALQACDVQAAAVPEGIAYVVGVDLQEGLYSFFSSDDTPGVMTVANWDGSIVYQQEVYSGWYETMRIYNEQRVYLPESCQGEFHLSFAASAYDTGTRGLYLREPGTCCAGKDIQPGLYIVQNNGAEDAALTVTDESGTMLQGWSLRPGAQYTVLIEEGQAVTMGEGCLLRSMTTEQLFQEGATACVFQGRYIMGQQMPLRNYTFTGLAGEEAFVQVSEPERGVEEKHSLAPGESWTLDIDSYGTRELLVEMVNVDVIWTSGEG